MKLTPGVLAVTDKTPGPPLGTLLQRKISVFAVTVLLDTVTTEGDRSTGTSVALPIRAFVPSLIKRPDPTFEIAMPEVDTAVFIIWAIVVVIVVPFLVTANLIDVPLAVAVQACVVANPIAALDVVTNPVLV